MNRVDQLKPLLAEHSGVLHPRAIVADRNDGALHLSLSKFWQRIGRPDDL